MLSTFCNTFPCTCTLYVHQISGHWRTRSHTLATVSGFTRVLGKQTQVFMFVPQVLCPLGHLLGPSKFVCLFYVYLMTVYKHGKCSSTGMIKLLSAGLTCRLYIIFFALQHLVHTCSGNRHAGLQYPFAQLLSQKTVNTLRAENVCTFAPQEPFQ